MYYTMNYIPSSVHGYSLLRTQLNNEYFHELFDESTKFGVDIEGHRWVSTCLSVFNYMVLMILIIDTETGPGVFESALAYTSALRMADNAILFKYVAKSIGMKRGVVPSFMAKPWGNVSRCPSSTSSLFICLTMPDHEICTASRMQWVSISPII
jgi:glutamine synthetase